MFEVAQCVIGLTTSGPTPLVRDDVEGCFQCVSTCGSPVGPWRESRRRPGAVTEQPSSGSWLTSSSPNIFGGRTEHGRGRGVAVAAERQ